MKNTQRPIGIYDSGIGGLTVAHAITKLLPGEDILYFGDTAHLPYGDKSEAAIQAYSIKIADVLLKKGCKAIVIACNSASSAAYELLKEYVRNDAHILNVIDPMIAHVCEHFAGEEVGLIGTRRTVASGVYHQRLAETCPSIKLRSLATPLLAPMIEEGFFNNQISHEIIAQYLSESGLEGIKALILACTHYPLIKKEIDGFYNGHMAILDSSEIVAMALKDHLEKNGLAHSGTRSSKRFFVSDYTPSFEASTRLFFGKMVHLEQHRLWN
ncbi:MAG TPA: glutamate racemase [Cyclobacteriaceae bacterium]|nr:glutamate racemase [Cyclobacteriaceae bacterium]MCB9238384.1 glutamate racemase [Flammeovirgaceae bacterium]MCB0499108.1 glutamate racemase [Cyclobacteriaceae bacterium]MCO5272066.1 glutamate racemase [Cyclobacteriaceae bacterium]MCW5902898.1 glutamate racemase [Cyclobacteriaceae bacterium]